MLTSLVRPFALYCVDAAHEVKTLSDQSTSMVENVAKVAWSW